MKRNTLAVAAIAFAATTAAIGTAVASFLPTVADVAVYVRRDEPTAGTLISAGTHTFTPTASGIDVLVNVNDTRTTPTNDQRKARNISDVIYKTAGATTLNSSVVIN
jgi:hypothetical protein